MKKYFILLLMIMILSGCSSKQPEESNQLNINEIYKEEVEQLVIKNRELESENFILNQKLEELEEKERSEEFDNDETTLFELCEFQFKTGKNAELKLSNLYSLPDMNSNILNKNITGLVNVLYEVDSNDERWAYVQPVSLIEMGINAFGYVKYEWLESVEQDYEINRIFLSENFSIGMTLDDVKFRLGTNYLIKKELASNMYFFYSNNDRLVKEIENVNSNSFTRAGYEDAVICNFTNETNQLKSMHITTSSYEVLDGILIGDEYEQVKNICEIKYNLLEDGIEEGGLTCFWSVGTDLIELVFYFDNEERTLTRIYVTRYNH